VTGGHEEEKPVCVVPHHCSYDCTVADDCPTPESGTATVVCSGATSDVCQLDCASGECPDGMVCITLGPMSSVRRCAFNP
jgi:hypothetical protein